VWLYATAGPYYCRADASGYVKGTYDNAAGTFTIDSSVSGLTISDVIETGAVCETMGIFDGDPAAAAGVITLSPKPAVS